MRTLTTLIFAGLACAALPAAAQDNGQQIATSGAGSGVPACASCHGAQGEGNPASGFPRLAGQSQAYLAHQLNAYAHGGRDNPVMGPIAKALSAQQIDAVSGYYAGLKPAAAEKAPKKASATQGNKRAHTLATVGDSKREIQACANCHGPGGRGEPPSYPYLAGQNEAYLKSALSAWKSGARNTDPTGQMQSIAKRLNDSDISALAAYFAAQPTPAPLPLVIRSGPGSTSGTSGTAGTQASGPQEQQQRNTQTQGLGVEQGAATAGGSQGPGGGGAASGSGPSGSKTGAGQ